MCTTGRTVHSPRQSHSSACGARSVTGRSQRAGRRGRRHAARLERCMEQAAARCMATLTCRPGSTRSRVLRCTQCVLYAVGRTSSTMYGTVLRYFPRSVSRNTAYSTAPCRVRTILYSSQIAYLRTIGDGRSHNRCDTKSIHNPSGGWTRCHSGHMHARARSIHNPCGGWTRCHNERMHARARAHARTHRVVPSTTSVSQPLMLFGRARRRLLNRRPAGAMNVPLA